MVDCRVFLSSSKISQL